MKLDVRNWLLISCNATNMVLAYIRWDLKGSPDSSKDRIGTESAEVPEFRFCSFEDGAVGVGVLPHCKELLVLRASF
jgi:hypothetical protein